MEKLAVEAFEVAMVSMMTNLSLSILWIWLEYSIGQNKKDKEYKYNSQTKEDKEGHTLGIINYKWNCV